MNGSTTMLNQHDTPSFAMIRVLTGIAMLSGMLVVLVYQVTKPIIAENKRLAIEEAVSIVVPGGSIKRDYLISEGGLVQLKFAQKGKGAEEEMIYAAYSENGELKGVAIEAAATGYQDVIRILYGYDPSCQCITGIKVLKMAETPGLGDKIAYDSDFLNNFTALDSRLNRSSNALLNEIIAVKHGTKTEPWQIDAISGATISSKAIGKMLNQSGQKILPLINQHLIELKKTKIISKKQEQLSE